MSIGGRTETQVDSPRSLGGNSHGGAGGLAVAVFVFLTAWSVWEFGGDRLVEELAHRFGISFRTAALLVSVVVGLSGTFLALEVDLCRRKRRQ
jgi:hypothetical protein